MPGLAVFSLAGGVVALDGQVFWWLDVMLSADIYDPLDCAGDDSTKCRGPVLSNLIAADVEVRGEPMC